MILRNCKIFNGEKFIPENVVIIEKDKIIKIISENDFSIDAVEEEMVD